MATVYIDDGNKLGRLLTRDEFVKLDPGKVFDDLTAGGCCGTEGVLFITDSGSIGIEDAYSGRVIKDDEDETEAAE